MSCRTAASCSPLGSEAPSARDTIVPAYASTVAASPETHDVPERGPHGVRSVERTRAMAQRHRGFRAADHRDRHGMGDSWSIVGQWKTQS